MAAEILLKDLPRALEGYKSATDFGAVVALTRTAKKMQFAAKESLEENFTLRNTWSSRGVAITPATPKTKFAEVYIKPGQSYLAAQEEGARLPARQDGINIPSQIREAAGIPEKKVIPKSFRVDNLESKKKRMKKTGNQPFHMVVKKTGTEAIAVRRFKYRPVSEAGSLSGKKKSKIASRTGVSISRALNPVEFLYIIKQGTRTVKKQPWYEQPVMNAYQKFFDLEYEKAVDQSIERFLKKEGIKII
jgi:hypothetical protein